MPPYSDNYSSLTTKNSSILKRFSHSTRFNIAVDYLDIKTGDCVLDFGTGDGELLFRLEEKYGGSASITGYEPVPEMFHQLQNRIKAKPKSSISIVNQIPADRSFNKVSCLEVLEHFSVEDQIELLNDCKKVLKDGGLILISVPIEIGFSGFMKNIARIVLGQTHDRTTMINVIKSLLGLEIGRPDTGYIFTHIGFNHKRLEKTFFEVGLKIQDKAFSPFPFMRGVLNSQVLYTLKI